MALLIKFRANWLFILGLALDFANEFSFANYNEFSILPNIFFDFSQIS